jgi:hypothetical protein
LADTPLLPVLLVPILPFFDFDDLKPCDDEMEDEAELFSLFVIVDILLVTVEFISIILYFKFMCVQRDIAKKNLFRNFGICFVMGNS